MATRKTRSVPYRAFTKGKKQVSGIQIRHEAGCPAYLPEHAKRACRCTPFFKPRYGQKRGDTYRDEASALTALGAMRKGTTAVREREAAGWTLGEGADEWLDGVKSGHIKRRRRGKAEPYSATTIPDYERIVRFLCDAPDAEAGTVSLGLGDRRAREIDTAEWWDIFESLRKGEGSLSGDGLSYSRRASIRSVVANVYEYMSQRALRERTGITSNPVAGIDLGANNGTSRDRVALPEEATELLDALDPLDRVPFALAFYGGPRRGDIKRVDWSDLEFVDSAAGHKVPGYNLFIRPFDDPRRGPGKVGDGRWIPLAPQLRTVLLEEWQRQGRPTTGAIVERSVTAGHLYKQADKAWVRANERKAEALGQPVRPRPKREAWGPEHMLEPIRLHECRHTYCSWLVRSKAWDVDAMMKFMGHTQLSTFQRYMHTVQEHGPREQTGPVDVFGEASQDR